MVMNMLMISIKDMDKKELHAHAHRLLRECLRPLDIDYGEDTPVIKGKMGKPSLADRPDIHYNLSHAKGIAACIVSEQECGIDCENVREHRPNVMRRAFSESERQLVESASPEERGLLFFPLWTLKEAYVKAIGRGIGFRMQEVSFQFRNDEILCSQQNADFYQTEYEDYQISVCITGVQSE